jgi:subtilisin
VKLGNLGSPVVVLVGVLVLVLGLAMPGAVLAASPGQRGGPASRSTQQFIVTLNGLGAQTAATDAGAPVGLSSAPQAAGAVAAAARAAEAARVARIDNRIDQLQGLLGFRTTFRYHWAVQGFAAWLTPLQLAALRANPAVASVAPVVPVRLADVPTVPTGIRRAIAEPADVPSDVSATLQANPSAVNVAVIDTGIRHIGGDPELNVVGGVDCSNHDGEPGSTRPKKWKDVDGHGTHVAGTIGAEGANGEVIGVAPGVALWSVRVFWEGGGTAQGSSATVDCGVDWVAQTHSATPPTYLDAAKLAHDVPPIDLANMSIQGPVVPGDAPSCGGPALARTSPDVEHVAVCNATDAGVTFVVAAGNSSTSATRSAPGAYAEAITVSALSDYNGLPGGGAASPVGCSARGADDSFADYSNYGTPVDLIAPGTCITSLAMTDPGTRVLSGTSMATPHVTGAAAVFVAALRLADPDATPNSLQIRDALRAAASYDWNWSSDPDATPDRLLDVGALFASPALGLTLLPSRLTVTAGNGDLALTGQLGLQRLGGWDGAVDLTADAPPGVTVALGSLELSGLDDSGLDTSMAVTLDGSVADGDIPITITATPQPTEADDTTPGAVQATMTLHVDRHVPTVNDLQATIQRGASLGSAIPLNLSWSGDDGDGTILHYLLRRRSGNESWQTYTISPSTAGAVKLIAPRIPTTFQVRAVDTVGNASHWLALDLKVAIRDSSRSTITYSGPWMSDAAASAWHGSLKTSHHRGASAQTTFSGRGVAWVAQVGPDMGTAAVFLDGVRVETVDLSAGAIGARRMVYASAALDPATQHTLRIKVKGGTVSVDALLILH